MKEKNCYFSYLFNTKEIIKIDSTPNNNHKVVGPKIESYQNGRYQKQLRVSKRALIVNSKNKIVIMDKVMEDNYDSYKSTSVNLNGSTIVDLQVLDEEHIVFMTLKGLIFIVDMDGKEVAKYRPL